MKVHNQPAIRSPKLVGRVGTSSTRLISSIVISIQMPLFYIHTEGKDSLHTLILFYIFLHIIFIDLIVKIFSKPLTLVIPFFLDIEE